MNTALNFFQKDELPTISPISEKQKALQRGGPHIRHARAGCTSWEATGSVVEACRKAYVGRGTFYYWKPRFEAEGYAGLETYKKKGPEPGSVGLSAEVKQKVIEMRRKHADWGKHRFSDEMATANNWVTVISPNTVRRVLEEAKLWKPEETRRKQHLQNSSAHCRRAGASHQL